MVANKIRITFLGVLLSLISYGQDQTVSIAFRNESLQQVLLKLDSLTELQLSYNPQILNADTRVTKSYASTSAEDILKDILGQTYQVKNISNYLIIQKAPPKKAEKVTFELKGGVRDANTGQQLEDVTIYEVNSLQSTLTNDQGEFELQAVTSHDIATFAISKRNYRDTIIQISRQRVLDGPITLQQEPVEESSNRFSIREKVKTYTTGLANFFTSDKVQTNARNLNFRDTRTVQFSLIPSVGTNRKLSGQIRNEISINLLAGYSYGVRGFEIGGLYNITREEAQGAQIGGFGNTNGGEVRGLQLAGFLNTTDDYVDGMQMAGFLNIASDSVSGFQAAGFTNITRDMSGFQIAGFNNHTGKTSGVQMAGFVNTSGRMSGLQMAGFVNMARQVNGVQMSVVNLADSVGSGIQFGLLNISRKNGFISPAFESNDIVPYQLAFRSGVEYFYSVLFAGMHSDYWNYGVGFGSRVWLSKTNGLFFNPELRWVAMMKGKEPENENSNVVKLDLSVGYKFFRHLSVSGGPSVNFYFTNRLDESGIPQINIAGNTLTDELSGDYRYQVWIGYTLRIGF